MPSLIPALYKTFYGVSKRYLFFFALFCSLNSLKSQDTISVYFDFGISKIRIDQFEILNAIPVNYDLSNLDSVLYLGMADSVGGYQSNIKLSEKRAKNVSKYCAELLPENISIQTAALGEKTIPEREKNRRVDIILYFKSIEQEYSDTTKIAVDTDSSKSPEQCYYISYDVINYSHIRTIQNKNKQSVLLELNYQPYGAKQQYYYGSKTENDVFKANKLRWSAKRTGKLWWAKTRYIATIPKENYDTWKIFTIEDPPCDSCCAYLQNNPPVTKGYPCVKPDGFLMENFQYKTGIFHKDYVKVRIPREYVNMDENYYIDNNASIQIKWESKSGKKKKNYYFARLPLYSNHIANIYRKMICCDKPGYGNGVPFCATNMPSGNSAHLLAEIGNHYQQTTHTPYAAIGFAKEGKYSRYGFFAGTDIDLSLYSSLRYQYNFYSFTFNPFSSWTEPTYNGVYKRYWRFYLGTEIKTRINDDKKDYLEQNLHAGIAWVKYKPVGYLPRIFFQYGWGYDYLGEYASSVYPILQLGVDFYIASFRTKPTF